MNELLTLKLQEILRDKTHNPKLYYFWKKNLSLLTKDLFKPKGSVTLEEKVQLSYQKMHFIKHFINDNRYADDILTDPSRIILLNGLLSLVDPALWAVVNIHYLLCINTILKLRSDETHLANILDELLNEKTVGLYLATELGYGSNLFALKTQARYDVDTNEFVINTPDYKSMKYMPNTGLPTAKIAIVFANLILDTTDYGVFPFVVPIRNQAGDLQKGVFVTRLEQIPDFSLDNAITTFKNVRVPRENILLGPNLPYHGSLILPTRNKRSQLLMSIDAIATGKLTSTLTAILHMQASLFVTVKYARQRKVAVPRSQDTAVIEYKSHYEPLLRYVAKSYAMNFFFNFLITSKTSQATKSHRRFSHFASIGKAMATSLAIESINLCRIKCGAQGLFPGNKIISYLIAQHGLYTAEGESDVLFLTIARNVIMQAKYQKLYNKMQIKHTKLDLTHTQDQLDFLQGCEKQLFTQLKGKLNFAEAGFENSWKENSLTAIKFARLYGQNLLAREFYSVIEKLPQNTKQFELLDLLLKFFNLTVINESMDLSLRSRLLSENVCSQVQKYQNQLGRELLQQLDVLVDGFGITNEVLNVPIAEQDYLSVFDAIWSKQNDDSQQADRVIDVCVQNLTNKRNEKAAREEEMEQAV
ncbi:MAG: acyl-CoA dehydrogenase [Pseudomonadota bacterium]